MRTQTLLRLTSLLLVVGAGAVHAQDTTTYEEQYKRIKAPQAYAQYGPDLFGDSVNLYNGGLEFTQTDVSLPGNSKLPVAIGRRLKPGSKVYGGRAFGRWEMDIPHLHGVYAKHKGWVSMSSTAAAARCTNYGPPPGTIGPLKSPWDTEEYWSGSYIYVPGKGDQRLLRRAPGNLNAPDSLPATYPVVTSENWSLACTPTLASDTSADKNMGQGFLAIAPDGTRYTFDWMVDHTAPELSKPDPSFQHATVSLPRSEVWILPTQITDRFGNWVRYTYDPLHPKNLTRIESNDGRVITLAYWPADADGDMLVQSVSDGTRTWNYSYRSSAATTFTELDQVTLPDNTSWKFAGTDALFQESPFAPAGGCGDPLELWSAIYTGTMVHPTGAVGKFSLTPTVHGRSDIPYDCDISGHPLTPRYFYTYSLTAKSISGAGFSPMMWSYAYGGPNASWAPCSGTCPTTKTVTVTDPESNVTQHVFGNRFRVSEGRIEQLIVGGRTTSTRYHNYTSTEAYPEFLGYADDPTGDAEVSTRPRPQDQRATAQGGANFTWEASGFDKFARPTTVKRYSSLGMSSTEVTTYNDNLNKWILGLIGTVRNSETGKAIVSNVYSTTGTVLNRSRFGLLEGAWTYNPDGTVSTSRDGKSNTTTYANYKRGIAQTITHPDARKESAVVNNWGGIDSVTNAATFKTAFTYDAVGRLKSVIYPTGDTVAWNATTLDLEQINAPELDLPAGHWRQTVRTGNARSITYLDALMRPVYTDTADAADVAATARVVKRRFDSAGHTRFESYPKRTAAEATKGVQTNYDELGRVIATGIDSENGVLWSTTTYDSDFRKTVTDARGNATTTAFQAFDEPSENAIAKINAPMGVEVKIVRDVFGKPLSITRSGGGKSATRSYVYDTNARLCKTIEPETGATVQNYDAANNVLNRGVGLAFLSPDTCDNINIVTLKKISFTYDTLNRLLTTVYGDGGWGITRTYTADGLLATIASDSTVWTNTYNKRRLNERESLAYAGVSYNIDRQYDANGSLAQLTYPSGGMTVAYSPNALGEATKAGTYATGVSYHPNGAIAGFTYGNGIRHTMSQNTRGLPEAASDTGVLNDKYSYDENGNVSGIQDLQLGTASRTMQYDLLDRLSSVNAPALWGTAAYNYDAIDNLTSTSITAGLTARTTTHNFDSATNRLSSTSNGPAAYNFAYSYDVMGNIIKRGAQAYVFDLGNRMRSATNKATYNYDGLGHRYSIVGTDGVNRLQVYSQGGQLLTAGPTSGVGTVKYVYLKNHQIAEVK